MSQATLHDKLQRLRRKAEPPPAPAPASLGRLKQSLLGAEAEDGLSLRERLERLVAVAARRDRARGVEAEPDHDAWPPVDQGDVPVDGTALSIGGPRVPLDGPDSQRP